MIASRLGLAQILAQYGHALSCHPDLTD